MITRGENIENYVIADGLPKSQFVVEELNLKKKLYRLYGPLRDHIKPIISFTSAKIQHPNQYIIKSEL